MRRGFLPPGKHERGQSIVEFALLAPIMIFLLFAILDFARIYTAMMSVESAAREAADFGTTLGAGRWDANDAGVVTGTVAEMRRRACTAASDLHDFEGVDEDGLPGFEDCTNPSFAYCVTPQPGGTCSATVDPLDDCHNPERPIPCTVTVTMSHLFHLFVPFQIDFFGVQLGLPATLAFERDSTFAMSDITLPPAPSP